MILLDSVFKIPSHSGVQYQTSLFLGFCWNQSGFGWLPTGCCSHCVRGYSICTMLTFPCSVTTCYLSQSSSAGACGSAKIALSLSTFWIFTGEHPIMHNSVASTCNVYLSPPDHSSRPTMLQSKSDPFIMWISVHLSSSLSLHSQFCTGCGAKKPVVLLNHMTHPSPTQARVRGQSGSYGVEQELKRAWTGGLYQFNFTFNE